MTKRQFIFPLVLVCQLGWFAPGARAQASQDALIFPIISGQVFSFNHAVGVGWSFVPQANLLVTGLEAAAPQVSFWQGSNQVLATYSLSGASVATTPSGNFAAITPLVLNAGQLYFISCQNVDASGFAITAWGRQGAEGLPAFTVSSPVSQFASYYLLANSQWSPTVNSPQHNTDVLIYGPNFQFQVVPEPKTTGLFLTGLIAGGGWLIRRLKSV